MNTPHVGASRSETRDQIMLNIAYEISRLGTCKRRQVGAVAVDRYHRVLAIAHNGLPKDYPHCSDNACGGAFYASGTNLEACEAIHAEANLLTFVADIMRIDTVYLTHSPCRTCIKSLANTSCQRLVFAAEYPHPEAQEYWLRIPGRSWELFSPQSLQK